MKLLKNKDFLRKILRICHSTDIAWDSFIAVEWKDQDRAPE